MKMLSGEGVTIPEAASRLGLSIDGVRKRLQRGTLESYKENGRVMVVLPKAIESDGGPLVAGDDRPLVQAAEGFNLVIRRLIDCEDTICQQAERIGILTTQVRELRRRLDAYRVTDEDRRSPEIPDE